ncbi:hypothetical protein AZL_011920 [Azospirillum sp. B510]|uniref:hypothetical protein n=1 Tax=Azospirillum sp. (strain B510) TaxID=137722 RepID=UPI0001C4C05B|nr:hypothetical protein [Azospirillum sp. B510]BAI71830.1 hypothetical protein AZL_011920 [Azospirillum sp. B510]
MERNELTELGLMRVAASGVAVFDALYIDNSLMTSELVKREFMLAPGEDRQNWVFHGVHVAATRSISQRRLVKYEFISGNDGWKMLFDGRLDRAGNSTLDARRSRITWVSDHKCDRKDKGQQARVELNNWLAAALGDNETE